MRRRRGDNEEEEEEEEEEEHLWREGSVLGDGGGIGGARFLGDWREILLVWCSAEVIQRGDGRGWSRVGGGEE